MNPRFDSILVRLKVLNDRIDKMKIEGFDSILVRLKVNDVIVNLYRLNAVFRFHTGSIKST